MTEFAKRALAALRRNDASFCQALLAALALRYGEFMQCTCGRCAGGNFFGTTITKTELGHLAENYNLVTTAHEDRVIVALVAKDGSDDGKLA